MDDLISREWVMKRMVLAPDADVVRMAPAVDAEPVLHGRYIPFDEDTWECSACGVLWTFLDGGPEDNEAGYCPKCGARMDGGETHAAD